MSTMILNNVLPSAQTNSSSSTTRDGDCQAKPDSHFATLLLGSVKAVQTTSKSSSAATGPADVQTTDEAVEAAQSTSTDTQVNQVNGAVVKTVPKFTKPAVASKSPSTLLNGQSNQSNIVGKAVPQLATSTVIGESQSATTKTIKQGPLMNDSSIDESDVETGKTTNKSTSVANPYDLLMLMLQTSTLPSVANVVTAPAKTAAQPRTASDNIPVAEKSTSEISAQNSLLQLLDQAKLSVPQNTQASVVKTAITVVTGQGNLTSAQLSQAIAQSALLLQSKPVATTTVGEPVALNSPALTANVTDSPSQDLETAPSQLAATNTVKLLNGEQLNRPFSVRSTASQATTGTGVARQLQVPIVTDDLAQTVPTVANQPQITNPLLTALQAQLSGKLILDPQVSTRNAQSGSKTLPVAKDQSSLTDAMSEAATEKKLLFTSSAPKDHNAFLFDANQLLPAANDGSTNHLADTTGGNFSQLLHSEQSQSTAISTGVTTSQGTLSKDSLPVMQQIVDQAKLITRVQNTEMVIRLKPEHLGELTLKITVEHGIVNATFHSNNSEVRAAIESSLPQLKQDLANSGLKIDNVGVYTGLDQFTSNQQQNNTPQYQGLKFSRKTGADNFDEAAQLVTENQRTGTDGVDYRI